MLAASTASITPDDFSVLCDVIRAVARNSGLPPDDADDFSQTVHLRLLERNYAPVALFAGRSSLRTYLTAVVRRMLLDWRNARFGKWRPLSLAREQGAHAMELDRLVSRDGYPVAEAIAIVEDRFGAEHARDLTTLATRLVRRARPRFIPVDEVEVPGEYSFDDPIEAAQARAERRRAIAAVRAVIRRLDPADRQLLHLRLKERLAIAAIADFLGEPRKPLYRRFARLLRKIQREVAAIRSATTTPASCGERPVPAAPPSSRVH